jgi:hypothetical protein
LGIFVNSDVDVTSHLTISAGVPYSRDRKQGQIASGNRLTPMPQPCNVHTFCHSSYDFDDTRTFSNTSPRFALKYQFSPLLQDYGSYFRGYRAGGYNLRNTSGVAPRPFEDEKADSVEVGVKGGRLRPDPLQCRGLHQYRPRCSAASPGGSADRNPKHYSQCRVGDLPRTASGKVRKDILRSRIASTTQQKTERSQHA